MMDPEKDLRCLEITRHRNGVCGQGWNGIVFMMRDENARAGWRRMHGTLFAKPDDREEQWHYAVIDLDNPSACWRGDHFADWLHEQVQKENAR